MAKPNAWSQREVELIVSDYIEMLCAEYHGVAYSKTYHRVNLLSKLDNRSPSSIEMKHRNISYALQKLGYRHITGYKPLANVQQCVVQIAELGIAGHPELFVDFKPHVIESSDDSQVLEVFDTFELASRKLNLLRSQPTELSTNADRELLEQAKQLVYTYESSRLMSAGLSQLSARVSMVSESGFHILSYSELGNEIQVLVKVLTREHPDSFNVTADEYFSSKLLDKTFRLYVVFWIDHSPMAVVNHGVLDHCLKLRPNSYTAHL
jgi:hypothetical protein